MLMFAEIAFKQPGFWDMDPGAQFMLAAVVVVWVAQLLKEIGWLD